MERWVAQRIELETSKVNGAIIFQTKLENLFDVFINACYWILANLLIYFPKTNIVRGLLAILLREEGPYVKTVLTCVENVRSLGIKSK